MSCISIHALREESDSSTRSLRPIFGRFQSTLSVRRATQMASWTDRWRSISIHALREESDYSYAPWAALVSLFQSTLSVRRATAGNEIALRSSEFQSTLSVRRATTVPSGAIDTWTISIHALREESDCGRHLFQRPDRISIHALREESDLRKGPWAPSPTISIHALREESDPS